MENQGFKLVLGSAPQPVIPREGRWRQVICVNSSGWMARKLGLKTHDLTILGSFKFLPHRKGDLLALEGLETDSLMLIHHSYAPTVSEIEDTLGKLSYRYRNIEVISVDQRASIISSATGYQFHDQGLKVSNGVFAVCVALQEKDNKVVIAGISLEKDGHSHGSGNRVRGHRLADRTALWVMRHKCCNLWTTEEDLTRLTGIRSLQ